MWTSWLKSRRLSGRVLLWSLPTAILAWWVISRWIEHSQRLWQEDASKFAFGLLLTSSLLILGLYGGRKYRQDQSDQAWLAMMAGLLGFTLTLALCAMAW